MLNWVDWLIVAIVGYTALCGLRRGLVLTLTRFVGQIGALVAAFVLTRPASALLETRFGLASRLAGFVARFVRLPEDFGQVFVDRLSSGQLWGLLDRSGLPVQYREAVVTWIADAPGAAAVSLTEFIHQGLGMLLLNVITFVGLLVLANWVVSLFGRGVSGTVRHMGADPLDRLGGLGLGGVQGALICAVVLGLGMPFLATSGFAAVGEAVDGSLLAAPLLNGFYVVSPWLRQIGAVIWERLA